MATFSRIVEVTDVKPASMKREIRFSSGTSLQINEDLGGFEVYGRLRKRNRQISSLLFDRVFRVSSSATRESSMSRKTLSREDLRSIQLEDTLCNIDTSSHDIDSVDGNQSVHERRRFEIVKIKATGFSSDDGDGAPPPSLVKVMQVEFVIPLATIEIGNEEKNEEKCGGGPERMSYKDVRLGREEVCLLRGSVSFDQDRTQADDMWEYELLVDGIDLVNADITIAQRNSLSKESPNLAPDADMPPLIVGDHSDARTKSSLTNPLVLMLALFALKLWFLIGMVVITVPNPLLNDLARYAQMAVGLDASTKPVISYGSATDEGNKLIIRSVKQNQRPAFGMKLLPPPSQGENVFKWLQIFWALTLLISAVVATTSLFWDAWSYWRARRDILRRERSNTRLLTMLVHAYNSWGFCGAVEEGMALPFYGMPSTFVQAFHDGSPALAINAAAVPLSLGLIIWRALKLPWAIFKRLNRPPRLGKPSTKERPPFIASDMYTLIADRSARSGLLCGFLSQKQQFGCISLDESYSTCLVRCACDGVVVSSSTSAGSGIITTDWLWVEAVPDIDVCDPLAMYMDAAGRWNRARLSPPRYCHPPHRHLSSSSPAPLLVPGGARVYGEPLFDQNRAKQPKRADLSIPLTPTRQKRTETDDITFDKFSPPTPPSGWCSWYHFFERITESDLVENISLMRDLKEHHHLHTGRQGFSLFQVDDGYQRAWGDWMDLDRRKFPSKSLATVVDLIQGAGMTAGLWLAPFSCDKHSMIVKEHPEWILRNQRGVPANSANCGKFFYGLDTTHPGMRDYLKVVLSTLTKTWGFSYLKLDFLYSSILPDAFETLHDRTKTRAQVFSEAMGIVTETMEEEGQAVYLLGCGSPIGAMIGHVHANRVSPDAGLAWLPEFPLPWWDRWNLPSARGMLRNTLSRLSQHGRWWCNDPDCMLLRTSTTFTEVEIVSILTVKALSGGSFIISDDLSQVPLHRIRLAQQVLPATNLAAVPVDVMDSGMPERLRLPLGRGSERERSGKRMDEALGLGLWTLFAACHWDEDNRHDHYDPQPVLPGSSRKTRSNPFAWVMLDRKSHRVSLRELLGPHSAHLEAIRRKFSRSATSASGEGRYGVVLFLYDFWGTTCYTIDITPSILQGESDIGALSLVLPPVQRRAVCLLAVRAAEMLPVPKTEFSVVGGALRGGNGIGKERRPTVFTHRPSVAGLPSDLVDLAATADDGSTFDSVSEAVLKAVDEETLYPTGHDSDNESDLTAQRSRQADEEDQETEDGYDSEETAGAETPSVAVGQPLYLGSNLHFSCGLELAEMIVLSRVTSSSAVSAEPAWIGTVLQNELDDSKRKLFEESDSKSGKGEEDSGALPTSGEQVDPDDGAESGRQGQCCVLTFHEGMVRPRSWGGFFLVLLPLAPTATERVVVTTCTVPAHQASIQRQCVEDGISSPHKELFKKDHADMYLGIKGAPGGERTLPVQDVEVVKHSAAGTVLKVWVGHNDSELLADHFGPKGHGRAHWATRILIHY